MTIAIFASPIPKRRHACCTCSHSFEGGEELVSVLQEGEEEGQFQRADYCCPCWEKCSSEVEAAPNVLSIWRAKMVLSPEAQKRAMAEASREHAFRLLRDYMDDRSRAPSAYLLALYLERRKQLVRVRSFKDRPENTLLYEIRNTGEVIQIPRIDVVQERERLQQELLTALAEPAA